MCSNYFLFFHIFLFTYILFTLIFQAIIIQWNPIFGLILREKLTTKKLPFFEGRKKQIIFFPSFFNTIFLIPFLSFLWEIFCTFYNFFPCFLREYDGIFLGIILNFLMMCRKTGKNEYLYTHFLDYIYTDFIFSTFLSNTVWVVWIPRRPRRPGSWPSWPS